MTSPHDTQRSERAGARNKKPPKATKEIIAKMHQIEHDQEMIGYRKEEVLRQLGWEHSSSYPDCVWRWKKTIDGKVITEGTNGAFRLEVYLNPGDEESEP